MKTRIISEWAILDYKDRQNCYGDLLFDSYVDAEEFLASRLGSSYEERRCYYNIESKLACIRDWCERGFGLIEVMITIGILSVVALGLTTILNHAMLVSQTMDQKVNVTNLVTSMSSIASNAVTCTQAVTQTPQQYGSNLIFNGLAPTTSLPDYRLTVVKIAFNNAILVSPGVYHGDLVLSVSSNIPVYGGQTFAPRVIQSVYLTIDTSNTIIGCNPVMPVVTPPISPPSTLPNQLDFIAACTAIGGIVSGNMCKIR